MADVVDSNSSAPRQFPCRECGALLTYEPGTTTLKCGHCGAVNTIATADEPVEELDFNTALANLEATHDTVETLTVRCTNCGAETDMKPGVTGDHCPFCGAPIIANAVSKRLIKPRSLLPFAIRQDVAFESFRAWLASRWFAPNSLTTRSHRDSIKGVYFPAWTYDCNTDTAYTGERGDYYWTTEVYTTMENGKSVTRTRQVRRIRWSYASGRVRNTFDDVLVPAVTEPPPKLVNELTPWDLPALVPFAEEYLAGFITESYQIDLSTGFGAAREIMNGPIRQTVCNDIGGDEQRIGDMNVKYNDITFKHILLPMWISAYQYGGRAFRFVVNARTGEVQGERPYSWIKITLFVLMCVAIVGAAFAIYVRSR